MCYRSVTSRKANVFKPNKLAVRAAEVDQPAPQQEKAAPKRTPKTYSVKLEDVKAGDMFDAKIVSGLMGLPSSRLACPRAL